MAGSLFTARVRAYMRANAIPFVEITAGNAKFRNEIVPKIGRWIIPVIETPEGEIIQDGTDILDYFESNGFSKNSIYPQTPRHRAIAHLFELFGNEGMMRPAMHYRWNFDEDNLTFVKAAFRDVLPPELEGEALDAAYLFASGRMRKATEVFGVREETIPTVESSYKEFLNLLNTHLETSPYLLGARPTIADYALLGPLYPHLGRDPVPLHLMQRKAPHVFRWTERMNTQEEVTNHLDQAGVSDLFANDDVPETLLALMRFVAEDFLPEIAAHVEFTSNWLTENADLKAGTNGLEKPDSRFIGFCEFTWRGHQLSTPVTLYRLYLLQRLQAAHSAMSDQDKTTVTALFKGAGLDGLLSQQLARPVMRPKYLEVWGEAAP